MIVAGCGQCTMDYITVVDEFPKEDVKYEVLPWKIYGGGPAATACVALTRLGVKTRFMGLISDDPAGEFIKKGLIEEGVNIDFMVEKEGGVSQTAFIVANKKSEKRTIFWARPTVGVIEAGEIPREFLQGVDMLIVDGLMSTAALQSAKIARDLGVSVMYDAGSVRESSIELIRLCDYVVCSEVFSLQLKTGSYEKTLEYLLSLGVKIASVTLGGKGSITSTEGVKAFYQPAFKVNVVDTTGAGDVFHGGFMYGILQDWPIEKTVRFATALAGKKCEKEGGRAGIPTFEETLEFMKTI